MRSAFASPFVDVKPPQIRSTAPPSSDAILDPLQGIHEKFRSTMEMPMPGMNAVQGWGKFGNFSLPGVELVRPLDQVRLGRVDAEQIMEEGRGSRGKPP